MTEIATTAQAAPVPTRAEVLEHLRSCHEAELAGAEMCREHPDEDHGAKVLANFERLARLTGAAIALIERSVVDQPHPLRDPAEGTMGRLEHLRFGGVGGWTYDFGESACFMLSDGANGLMLPPTVWFALVELLEPHVRQARTGPLHFDSDLYEIKETAMPEPQTVPQEEPTYVCRCLGCGITRDDIERLKLDIRFSAPDAPHLHGTNTVLPICSRCICDAEVLGQALANGIAHETSSDPGTVACLLALRDKALFTRVDEHLGKFSYLAPVMQGFCSQVERRLEQLEDRLRDRPKPNSATEPAAPEKHGLVGALAGAAIGFVIGTADKPLEALRAVIAKAQELAASLEQRELHGAK